mmetsp:Transcript_22243/g.49666  ORF Transcript_22243/g.49666 Transcript_22243/m.49666 type:complete len:92 (+) Transcript_22243:244-519(+)
MKERLKRIRPEAFVDRLLKNGMDLTNLKDIKVGLVEQFQGQERNIILVSTVRSQLEYISQDQQLNIGLMFNNKRMNVCLSRAIDLMIVVGN